MTPEKAMALVLAGIAVEYRDGDDWLTFTEDHPVRLLWEREIRKRG